MILLVLFAFLAGLVTIMSPCILPVLPIILSSTVGGGIVDRSRPLGVISGFIFSFTFFTLFLSTIVKLSGIPSDAFRLISVIALLIFGLSQLLPRFQQLIEQLFSRLSGLTPNNQGKTGFKGGVLVGLSLGLLWSPCVGPILASVISLAIVGTVSLDTFIITLAYSLGTAIPMLLIMLGGQKIFRLFPLQKIQKVFGLIMILTAIAIYFNIDRKFQTFILNSFPGYGAGLVKIEDNTLVQKQLEVKKDEPKGAVAPQVIAGGKWFNSDPLTLESLRGKVLIVDFWTYTCINCQRTLPYLKKWYEKYKDKGLVIIGVHSPEFEFEKNPQNVATAIKDFGLTYPIVQDNDFSTWRAYNNRYWPAKYFIDAKGNIRSTHFGEGSYDESEKIIQELLKESGSDVSLDVKNDSYQVLTKTPETYLGLNRRDTTSKIVKYDGVWDYAQEYAVPHQGASLTLDFEAKDVYLVMGHSEGEVTIKAYLDGVSVKPVKVSDEKLYQIIKLESPGKHQLILRFPDSKTKLFAFTFG